MCSTLISGRGKACYLACYNSDQNVGNAAHLPTKTCRYIRMEFHIFGSKSYGKVIYAFFAIKYFLFFHYFAKSFGVYVYLYTRSIPTDSDKELL